MVEQVEYTAILLSSSTSETPTTVGVICMKIGVKISQLNKDQVQTVFNSIMYWLTHININSKEYHTDLRKDNMMLFPVSLDALKDDNTPFADTMLLLNPDFLTSVSNRLARVEG